MSEVPKAAIEAFHNEFARVHGMPVSLGATASNHQRAIVAGLTAAAPFMKKEVGVPIMIADPNTQLAIAKRNYNEGLEAAAQRCEKETSHWNGKYFADAIRALKEK